MLNSMLRIGLTAALFGLLFVPNVSLAQTQRPRKVSDEAKLFSDNAISDANGVIAKIKEKHKKDLWIETRDKIPAGQKASDWVKKHADDAGIDGVYILITTDPKHYEVYVGNVTREKGYFTNADRDEVKNLLKSNLGKKSDQALIKVSQYTLDTMNRHHPVAQQNPPKKEQARPVPAPQAEHPVAQRDPQQNSMPPWVGWVCMIVAVLFVVWIIYAVIRAMTGAMGGGGYGGGGGGYGMGGGGGGGFFTGMLGGLFGAMAGMWIYNSFFGGHASYGANGAVNWGGDNAAAGSNYQSDTGGTSEGGDWGGDDAGGGAADGGGDGKGGDGDWGGKGGGGEDAGGGDWGGGGGDAGGGDAGGDWGGGGDAGGDWGGGGGDAGGGDWGGGGGDFGGGGGGGDW